MTRTIGPPITDDKFGQNRRKRFRLVLLYALLLSPWIVAGGIASLKPSLNSPLDWVDADFAPRKAYDSFSDRFGSGDVIVMSWPGCEVDEDRLDRFTAALRRDAAFRHGDHWLLRDVVSGREMLAMMTRPPISLSVAEATRRLSGTMIGPDGKTTCVIIGLTAEGLRQRGRLVPLIRATAAQVAEVDHDDQRLAGPIMDGFSVDEAGQKTTTKLAPISSLIVFCVCVLCLGSLYTATVVFGIASVCQITALAMLHYSGGSMTALMTVLPPLVQVLAIAGGIHLVNYYRDALPAHGESAAVDQMLRVGWLPCVLSATTTAIGLGSLGVSGLVVVRQFGMIAAAAVITTMAILLVFVPGILAWRPPRFTANDSDDRHAAGWVALANWQQRHATLIAVVSVAAIIGLGIGVTRLEASVRIETLFSDDSRLLSDYQWIESHVGPLVPIEVVVSFDNRSQVTPAQKLDTLGKVGFCLASADSVQAVTSCLDFMPQLPDITSDQSAERRYTVARQIARSVNHFVSDDGSESWRITAKTSALNDEDYGTVLKDLKARLAEELATELSTTGVSLEVSGLMPLVHEIQSQLLKDLFSSFIAAFALIAVVMTIVQAGIFAGLVSMIPNVFPSIALFGVLGWMGHAIDIGSVMTASLAMGIAVDDTLHFLTFFQRQIDSGATRQTAVLATYRNCGRAMLQTTLVCGAGLATFALSDFLPTARFAWMMVALLTAAILGDLIILPAMILSPLGKLLFARNGTPADQVPTADQNAADRRRSVPRIKTVPRLALEGDDDQGDSDRRVRRFMSS
jgi:uncharacterized protein